MKHPRPSDPCLMPLKVMWSAHLCEPHQRVWPCPQCLKDAGEAIAILGEYKEIERSGP